MHLQFGIGNVVNDRLDQAGGLGGLLGSFGGGGNKTSGQGESRLALFYDHERLDLFASYRPNLNGLYIQTRIA